MKKVFISLLCIALALTLILHTPPVYAADNYLITITENTVLEDTKDNGMAVYIDSIIYIPYTTVNKLEDVSAIYNEEKNAVTVYRYKAIAIFELDTGLTYDSINKRTALVSAKMRNGVPYLPVSILSSWMNVHISFISPSQSGVSYPIIRLCSNAPTVSDTVCLSRNSNKIKAVAKARDIKSGHVNPEPPPSRNLAIMCTDIRQSQEDDSTTSIFPTIIESLTEYELQAGFFFSEDQLLPNFENIREIYATGFFPGIMLTSAEAPLEQAQRCSELYAQMLHVRVRLVCAPDIDLSDEQKAELTASGFLLWEPDHDLETSDISANKLISKMKTNLKNADINSTIRLHLSQTTLEILPTLYSYLMSQNFTTVVLDELTQPF